MFSEKFLDEISSLALKIAYGQRGENRLQDIPTLTRKFDAEMQELAEASEPWDELPDIGYYAACLTILGEYWSGAIVAQELEKRDVSLAQLEAGTLAKYRLRAVQPKDIEAEREAILSAVDPEKHGMRLYAVTTKYLWGSGSKHRFEECHLVYAEDAEAARSLMLQEKRGQGAYHEDADDASDLEFEVVEVDLGALREAPLLVYGSYHN